MGLLLQPLTVGAEYLRAVFHCIREREQRALAIVLSLCHFSPAGAWFHRGEMLEANALGHCLQSIVERTLVSILEAALSTNIVAASRLKRSLYCRGRGKRAKNSSELRERKGGGEQPQDDDGCGVSPKPDRAHGSLRHRYLLLFDALNRRER